MRISRMIYRWPRSKFFRSPYTCNLKVTQRCNLKCSFCGLWRRTGQSELSLENYRGIAETFLHLGLARVVVTGGEPFLRPDLAEIVALFSRRGFSTTVLTNGTLVTEKALSHLKRMGLNDLGVSLDTLIPEKQAAICGSQGVWEKAVKTLRLGVKIFPEGMVEALLTVTAENLNEIPDIVEFIHNDIGAWVVVNPVNVPPVPGSILSAVTVEDAPPFPAEKVDSVYDRLIKMKQEGYRILVTDRFLEDSRAYLKTGKFNWNCDAGLRYFTIFSDGSLAPCSDTEVIANIKDMTSRDFSRRQFRTQAAAVRNSCSGCIYSCWREVSYLFNEPQVWKERFRTVLKLKDYGKKNYR